MRPSLANTTVLTVALLVCLVGAVEAASTGAPDQLGVLLLVAVLLGAVLGGLGRSRVPVPVRRDLVRWLRSRAEITGEPLELIADRALATYRASLDGGPGSDLRSG